MHYLRRCHAIRGVDRPLRRFAMSICFLLLAGASAIAHGTEPCPGRSVAATAVRTPSDVQAFVECAAAYLAEHGPEEARRAFNEDERWRHGSIYLGVQGLAESGRDVRTYVFPPDPDREGRLWGETVDDFGTDLFAEIYRMMASVDAGWAYYSYRDPATGKTSPKATYLIEVDWDGEPAALGAGIYLRDLPGTCYAGEVNAAALGASPSDEALREFVRCAAMEVEQKGYAAKEEIETAPRWRDGSTYVFVLDMMGNQVMSGNPLRVDREPIHEWAGRSPHTDQFGGRDMIDVGGTFGETYLYYRAYDPMTWGYRPKTAFLKRVVAHGVPVLVGAGYYGGRNHSVSSGSRPSCEDNDTAAVHVRTRDEVPGFVHCAAEYVMQHGEREAHRAFTEDARWRSGPIYLFVDGIEESREDSLTLVYPPDPSQEGLPTPGSRDGFGTDHIDEMHRIVSLVDSGWFYYEFNNPATGRKRPKSSYLIEIDWNGRRAVVGAGVYAPDFPGTCDPEEVNAAALEADPGDGRLREFVNCAAMEFASAGYFAGPVLSRDPRWNHGSVYVFGINAETGFIEFSGNPGSFAVSGMIPELLFGGRDVIEAGALFGEMFWYYTAGNPATGQQVPKVSFVRLVRGQGVSMLVGAGYYP